MKEVFLPALFWIAPICAALALAFAFYLYSWIRKQDKGNEHMIQIADWVKEGALAYLNRQYKTVGVFFGGAFILLAIAG